jgi:hypothetical protein
MRRSGASSIGTASFLAVCVAGMHAIYASAGGPPFLVASDFSIGGTGHDRLTDLVVDANGNVYVAGVVGSYDFPGISSAAITNGGMDLRFVAKIPPLSRTASFVAVVGSPTSSRDNARSAEFGKDEAAGLAIDANGSAYLVAYDGSRDYPIAGGQYQATTGKKYVFKVSAAGQVSKFSSSLDPAISRVGAIALDGVGAIYLTGSARDGLQTTAGAPYPTSSVAVGCIAPYVMRLDPSGQTVVYATYLGYAGTQGQVCGGTQANGVIDPTGFALKVDGGGNAYVTGQSEPGLQATAGAIDLGTKTPSPLYFDGHLNPTASHAFVAKVNATGTALIYNARIGGSRPDRGTSIVIDGSGAAIVAGKTSSTDFPTVAATPLALFPFVGIDCSLWTPEVGFLSKLSADGRTVVFSGYLPMDGGQLDDCQARFDGTLNFEPARVALDASGNLLVAGFTAANNRDVRTTSDAIIPDPVGAQTAIGNQLFQIYSGDAQSLIYSTALAPFGVQGLALDRWQNVIIASSRGGLQWISPGVLPVDVSVSRPACAGQPLSLVARIAGSGDAGSGDFQIDGASIGSASIVNGNATKTATLPVGIHKVRATYHGAGSFDGYSSPDIYVPVNQAGTCQ